MWKIWANELLPKSLKSCPKFNKLPNLVTLTVVYLAARTNGLFSPLCSTYQNGPPRPIFRLFSYFLNSCWYSLAGFKLGLPQSKTIPLTIRPPCVTPSFLLVISLFRNSFCFYKGVSLGLRIYGSSKFLQLITFYLAYSMLEWAVCIGI